ncbi:hypothetical protein [Streptomyces sp. NBC_00199]|uniref:hypothetical protein n=1 Tax=Streptomyces sp. NBC_00199 TaxID=2975678 RepID=UPI0022524C56|nr:hypothetical protein [Streptomyces sp. NBC_00199]MCX5268520.1 hypothetical protein [Streptomyces sp. NBC_00199]
MSEYGGKASGPPGNRVPRSRLQDYAEMTAPPREPSEVRAAPPAPEPEAAPQPEAAPEPVLVREPLPAPEPVAALAPAPAPAADDPEAEARRRWFADLLEEFRQTAVLVPLGDGPGPDGERGLLTADLGGVRFILAFSDGQALSRYALARGEYHREWAYQTILGARLLDVAVPAAGVPCGVALDCADGPDGVVFPPVRGVVPDEVAVDREQGGAW